MSKKYQPPMTHDGRVMHPGMKVYAVTTSDGGASWRIAEHVISAVGTAKAVMLFGTAFWISCLPTSDHRLYATRSAAKVGAKVRARLLGKSCRICGPK